MSQDFIFGPLTAEAHRLERERHERQGLFHLPFLDPPDPLPEQPVTITVVLGPNVIADRVTVYYTTKDVVPEGRCGRPQAGLALSLERTRVEWDTLLWGYRTWWQGTIPGQPAGTLVRYTVEAWHSRTGKRYVLGEGERPRLFGYAVDLSPPSAWLRTSIIYQIFPDRFAPAPGRDFARDKDPHHDFFGGTLAGITARLDYLASLGVTALWLTPIFPSPSYHRYDATDYTTVDPRLGTLEDFHTLVREAHRRGIRIILDFVANHCSDQHPAFQQALADPRAESIPWFYFDQWPETYRTFFGVRSMPKWNVDHPAVREYLISAALLWLERGVDGFRLDHAHGPGYLFWAAFRLATRRTHPHSALFGEIVETPPIIRSFVGRMDGALDFMLLDMVRRFFAFHTLPPSGFQAFLDHHFAFFPSNFILLSFLDNHDMNRFLWAVGNDKRRLRLAALCLFTLPGPPIIYYGTEVGLSQPADVVRPNGYHYHGYARMPMPWDERQDKTLLQFFRKLIRLRKDGGDIWWRTPVVPVYLDDAQGLYAYARGPYFIALNNSPERRSLPIGGEGEVLLATEPCVDISSRGISLPPYGGLVQYNPSGALEHAPMIL